MNVDEVKYETEEVQTKDIDEDEVKAEDVAKDEEDAAEDYNYEGKHCAGTKMHHVDSLSQNHNTLLKLKQAQRQDDELLAIMHILEEKTHTTIF